MRGTIVTRETKDGEKRYHVVFRAGGKQRWKTFEKRRDAERFLTSTVTNVHDGTYASVQPIPMGELFDRWLSHSLEVREKQGLMKPSTAKSYRSMVSVHLRPAFQDYRSDRFTAETVSAWVLARADEIADGALSPKFYNNLVNLFHAILKWARSRGQRYLAHDPLTDVVRLPRPKIERDFLEPAEIAKLLEAAEAPDNTILYLAVYSGLRRGDLFGLQWSDLDIGASQLRVRRSIYQGDITRPKTAHSERSVDLPARIVELLAAYRESYPALEGDFIFRTDGGSPIDPDNWFKRSFVPTVKRAELRAIGLHTLRHTYA
ncbi:MAG: tyrosine-type recombinase/integrase, partial [Vicinamibacteria bacterium]